MAKKRLTPKQYRDEAIRRQIQITRYATGQTNYINSLIDELNEKIAKFCLEKEVIETKSQYAECKKYVRVKCIEYRDRLYNYLQKELKDFIIEQSKWVYANSPIKLEKVNVDKVIKNVYFTAYSDTDNIKSYVKRIFDQIFQTWNAQLSISYRTGQRVGNMIKLVIGRTYN
jgi:hypothetical protein